MALPKTPPKMIQVGLHSIMRLDDGEEDDTVRPTEMSAKELAEMREVLRLFEEAAKQGLTPAHTNGLPTEMTPQIPS